MAFPLGHIGSLDDFSNDLSALCQEHVLTNRAKGFVFIFDNPKTQKLRKSGIYNSTRAVLDLNKIAGQKLTIFYLDGMDDSARKYEARVDNFNHIFLDKIGYSEEIEFPCMLFFRIHKQEFSDFTLILLGRTELAFVYHDIKCGIQKLADSVDLVGIDISSLYNDHSKVRIIKGIKHYSIESFKVLLAGIPSAIANNLLGL